MRVAEITSPSPAAAGWTVKIDGKVRSTSAETILMLAINDLSKQLSTAAANAGGPT